MTTPSGRGFGKAKQKKPTTIAQTQFSNSYVQMVGVISTGPIEGIVDWTRGIFIDGTPVANSDGSSNFANINIAATGGTMSQPRLAGFADTINSESYVGEEVKQNLGPITKKIVNRSLDAIRLSLGVVLQEYPSSGGVLGLSVVYRVWIKEGLGPFVLRGEEGISGRFASLTNFDRYFPVNNAGGTISEFQVRVERVTPQDTNLDQYQRVIQWQTYTEIVEAKIRYPGMAAVAMQLNADQFDSIPEVTFKIAGRVLELPSNATINPDRGLDYTGVWNGLFYQSSYACADPAWILYDLLYHPIYGMGRTIDRNWIDKWSFYELSKYCNQLVPNGYGGVERRFTANVVLAEAEDAWRVIDAFRSIFRGFAYYQSGAVAIAFDGPSSPVQQFTAADVEGGVFNYVRPPLNDRYSVANVVWIDPNDNYRQAIEVVEIPGLVAQYGYRALDMGAFACTSQGQARRAGLAALLQPETVTFKARRFSGFCRPGDVIRIADNRRSEAEVAGVVLTATTSAITLDRAVTLAAGVAYTLSLMLDERTLEDRAVLNGAGSYTALNTAAFSATPPDGANWILMAAAIQPQLFRVVNVVPDPDSNYSLYEIFAIEYDPSKWGFIEQGWGLVPRPTRLETPTVVAVPRNVMASSSYLGTLPTLVINWDAPINPDGSPNSFIAAYQLEYKRGVNGEWQDTKTTSSPGLELDGLVPGFAYVVRVASIGVDGRLSKWIEASAIELSEANLWFDLSSTATTITVGVF